MGDGRGFLRGVACSGVNCSGKRLAAPAAGFFLFGFGVRCLAAWCSSKNCSGYRAAWEEEKEQLFCTQRQEELPSLAAWEEDTNNCSKCPQAAVPGAASQAEKKVKKN